MSRLIRSLVALVVVALVAAWAASPLLAVHRLSRAAEEGDAATLNRMVDYPAFRKSLKEEMSSAMLQRLRVDGDLADDLSGLGMILAPAVMSGLVDVAITPEVVAAIVETGEAPDPTRRRPRRDGADDKVELHKAYGYRDLNTFAVTLSRSDRPERRVALLMKRHGLFTWRLAGIDLNPDAEA